MYTVIFTACLDMHAETKAELLALKSEMQAQSLALKSEVHQIKAEAQAESLALKSETQALKTKIRQMEASMGSKIASIEKALMHGKNKTQCFNDKALFWMCGHSCQFRVRFSCALCLAALTSR